MYKVIIIDDEVIIREGLKVVVDWHEHGFHIIGEASDGIMGRDLVNVMNPDLILVDIRMPETDFNRLLKSQQVDVELHTAGAHKRTLTMFGENTEEGRQKFKDELEEVHQLFKGFVSDNRPKVDIEIVATGEAWYGQRALEQQLIDEIQTSDEYLIEKMPNAAVYEVSYEIQQSKIEKLVKRFAQLTTLIPTQNRVLARHTLD